MSQIVTVSANAAAYAAEPLRPSARVSGSSAAETLELVRQERRKADRRQSQQQVTHVVGSAAMSLFFLNAGAQRPNLPQTTLQEAEEAYSENTPAEQDDENEDGDRQAGAENRQEEAEAGTTDALVDEAMPAAEETKERLTLPPPELFANL